MTERNTSSAAVETKAPVVITYREIQAIVRKQNLAEGKSAQNYHPRPRRGKTRNERARGEPAQREANKLERGSWCNDTGRTGANHPTHTCNGHRYYRGTLKKTKPAMTGKNVRSQ